MYRKLLNFPVLGILCLVAATWPIGKAIAHNIPAVNALHTLRACRSLSQLREDRFLAIMGNFDTPGAHCLYSETTRDDLVGRLAAWLNGVPLSPSQLSTMPVDIQTVFIWYNASVHTVPEQYADATNLQSARFVANLAIHAWLQNYPEQGIALVRTALTHQERSVAESLTGAIKFRGDEPAYTHMRQQIAAAMPDYIDNYVHWYETMVNYQQWTSAALACEQIRKHNQPSGLAATCFPRLLFYQKEYTKALVELQQTLTQKPTDALVLTWLGITEVALQQWIQAEAYFTQAIQYNQDQAAWLNLYWQLGDCQRALGKLTAARSSYQIALRFATDATYRDQLTLLLKQVR